MGHSLGRIEQTGLLCDGDGSLGEALKDEIGERAFLGEFNCRVDPVARVAGARSDSDGSHIEFRSHKGMIRIITAASVMSNEAAKRNGMVYR